MDFLRERKFLLLILYFFSSLLLFGAAYFIAQDSVHTDYNYYLYNDSIINSIVIVNLVCLITVSLLFVYKILFGLKLIKFDIPKVNNLVLIVIGSFIFAMLVWYEFYYVTLFYHGEIKLFSGYLIGTSILLSIAITVIFSNRLKNAPILFVIFAALSYFFYECQVLIIIKYVDLMKVTF
jgi:hypothetical protein